MFFEKETDCSQRTLTRSLIAPEHLFTVGTMRQLFLLVLVVNREISCFTFLLLHFGQVTLPFSCSLKLCINENSFLQALQKYSYVGMLSPPLQDYR